MTCFTRLKCNNHGNNSMSIRYCSYKINTSDPDGRLSVTNSLVESKRVSCRPYESEIISTVNHLMSVSVITVCMERVMFSQYLFIASLNHELQFHAL